VCDPRDKVADCAWNTLVFVPLASFNYTSIDDLRLNSVKESDSMDKPEAKASKERTAARVRGASVCHE
jgi:hypothetical protein